jgi:tRNA G10  N-methylase Trm11
MVAGTDSPDELADAVARDFSVEEKFEIYVHRSLTRHIFVMARK